MKRNIMRLPIAKRGKAFVLLLVMIMSFITGCDNRPEALELAKAGQQTAETMATYYELLIQHTYDTWDFEAFMISADREPGDQVEPIDEAKLNKRIEELNKRIKLARTLAGTYKSMQELSSYDASGEISKSAGDLKDSIEGLGVLPGSGVVPTSLFKMVIEDLVKWKQSKDIRKASALISRLLEQLTEMFSREMPVYKSIVEERGNKITLLMNYLIGKKKVTSLGLLQKVPETFGLKLLGADAAVEDDKTRNALIELVKTRGKRIAQMSAQAADGIKQSLLVLIQNHRKLELKQGLTLSGLLEGLERAKAYIDEINKSRTKES